MNTETATTAEQNFVKLYNIIDKLARDSWVCLLTSQNRLQIFLQIRFNI